jgi:hypothetical protein
MALFLNGKWFMGLLDTGADVSVIAERHWPSTWPCVQATADLKGVGSATAPLHNACAIPWHDERTLWHVLPCVLKELPVSLWGRDVLQEAGAILYSSSAKVSHMTLQQGFDPRKGLEKSQQGIKEPISSMPHPPHMGLGYETSPTHF